MIDTSEQLTIEQFDDVWVVEGAWMQRLLGSINFADNESRMYFDRVLRESGVFERMEAWAADEGIEPVRVDGVRLEFADGSWALLRRSITEPAFTMRFEAASDEGLAELKARAAEKLQVKID